MFRADSVLVVGFLLGVVSAIPTRQELDSETLVTLADGKVQGEVVEDGSAVVFRGIPYAAPPVGARRWSNPEPAIPWKNTLQATVDPPSCPQTCDMPSFACANHTSEDCLYANVYTPRGDPSSARRPVVLFLYGGNFYEGGILGDLYDGRVLVNSTGAIIVVVNYRLGILGFLGGHGFEGNYGLMDQLQAMKWIQNNIAAFGGDPNQVTVWGQSAGSMSIAIWLTQPTLVKGLFHRAILESEPFGFPYRDVKDWENFQDTIARHLHCKAGDRGCLGGKTAKEIMAAQDKVQRDILADLKRPLALFVPYTPLVGSDLVPRQPILTWADVSQPLVDIPVILGTTKQEATLFIYEGFPKAVPSLEYDALVPVIYGAFNGKGSKVLNEYKCATPKDCRAGWGDLTTVSLFQCPGRNATRGLVQRTQRKSPTYRYLFDHPASDGAAQPIAACRTVSCHAADLPFWWSDPAIFPTVFNWTDDERHMSSTWTQYLGSFFHSGVPAAASTWPTFDATDETELVIQTPAMGRVNHYLAKECDFWDSIGYPAA